MLLPLVRRLWRPRPRLRRRLRLRLRLPPKTRHCPPLELRSVRVSACRRQLYGARPRQHSAHTPAASA